MFVVIIIVLKRSISEIGEICVFNLVYRFRRRFVRDKFLVFWELGNFLEREGFVFYIYFFRVVLRIGIVYKI